MSQTPDSPAPESPAEEKPPSTSRATNARPQTPVQRVTPKSLPVEDPAARRDFFSEAMRETLAPFVGIIERRINPFLAALEALPDDVERLTHANISLPGIGPLLDQPPAHRADTHLPCLPPEPIRYLRPPGALPPGEFESRCTRCGKCVEVCPAHAIRLDSYDMSTDGMPTILAATQPCVVCDTLACMNNCPSGALQVIERLNIKMGTAKVDRDTCRRESGEDCRFCIEACPIDGTGATPPALAAIFIHAETGRIRVRKNVCIGCGLCESRCPVDPPAITIQPHRPPTDPIVA